MKIKYILPIILIIIMPSIIFNQSWKKSLNKTIKKESKKIEKTIKNEIKPLTIDFKISKIGYNPLKSLNKLNLTIDFTGNNPNNLGITFDKTEFELSANGKFLSKFYNSKKIKIPKNDDFMFQETAEIKISEAGRTIFNSILKKNVIYAVIGKYHVNTPLGTYSFDIKLLEKEVNPKKNLPNKKTP